MRLFQRTNFTLFIGYWVFMIIAYSTLPDQIPIHFGADGDATRFSGTSIFSWFFLPTLVSIIMLFILYLNRVNINMPLDSPWYNYPFKERILKLDEEQWQPFKSLLNRHVGLLVHTTFFWMILLFLGIDIYSYIYTTTEHSISLYPFVIVHLLLIGIYVGWWSVQLKRRLKLKLSEVDKNSMVGQVP